MWQKNGRKPKIKIQAARDEKKQIKGIKPQNEKNKIQIKQRNRKILCLKNVKIQIKKPIINRKIPSIKLQNGKTKLI